jgi:hypothetical protein
MTNMLKNKEVVSTVRERVLSLLNRRNGTWQGTMSDLLTAIAGRSTPEVWPGSASSLRRVVNKVVPSIRREGYRVSFTRTSDHDRKRVVSFSRRTAVTANKSTR